MEIDMNKGKHFPNHFIWAGSSYSTLEESVAAPYFRRSFFLESVPDSARLVICGLGFYELYLNGHRITKGRLAPYISRPDHLIYYDAYEVKGWLQTGENVLGVWLGNGFLNNPGGYVWDFDKAVYRGTPRFAMELTLHSEGGKDRIVDSGEDFRTAPSPLLFDDYRIGEVYDARKEIPDWNLPWGQQDREGWSHAGQAERPHGEPVLCEVEPIREIRTIQPVQVQQLEDGWLFDFGENTSGVCRLKICGQPGQQIVLQHGERLLDGRLDVKSTTCDRNETGQQDIYICKGGWEQYQPVFTYHGFQYVLVKGLLPEQLQAETLVCVVLHTDLKSRGNFSCSDETLNAIYKAVQRSTLTNFHYFPTDCPQREKNGWTGDAALSAEHTLLEWEPESCYHEWLRNVRKVQAEDGALPGIVPTAGWGFAWGNGPAWDCALIWLPYYTYRYRGDREIVEENAHSILRYLDYLSGKIRDDGLISFGLGDWLQTGTDCGDHQAPVELTDTLISMDMCRKAAYLYEQTGRTLQQRFAEKLYEKLWKAAREHLIDPNTMLARGNCQTSQAMALYYGLFTNGERSEAFARLREMIDLSRGHMDVGILGARVLFHVLSDFGCSELAFDMIVRRDFPSYGYWISQGATTLWEEFYRDKTEAPSHNHHFWGDVSHWMLRHLAGISYCPRGQMGEVDVRPSFPRQLSWAEGYYDAPEGRIYVRWERRTENILLQVQTPEQLKGSITLEWPYVFHLRRSSIPLESGEYEVSLYTDISI